MNVAAIIQARMGSSRLPGKVLMDIEGKPMLQRVIDRVKMIKGVDEIVVATTCEERDREIVFALDKDVRFFCGSEDDVLSRYRCCPGSLSSPGPSLDLFGCKGPPVSVLWRAPPARPRNSPYTPIIPHLGLRGLTYG